MLVIAILISIPFFYYITITCIVWLGKKVSSRPQKVGVDRENIAVEEY